MELVVVVGVYGRWTHVQLAFPKKKNHVPKILAQKKHMTKERANKCREMRDYKCKRWACGGN